MCDHLLLHLGLPVLDERDRRGDAVQFRIDEETPVRGDLVLPTLLRVDAATNDRGRKERHRRAGFDGGSRDCNDTAIIAPAGLR